MNDSSNMKPRISKPILNTLRVSKSIVLPKAYIYPFLVWNCLFACFSVWLFKSPVLGILTVLGFLQSKVLHCFENIKKIGSHIKPENFIRNYVLLEFKPHKNEYLPQENSIWQTARKDVNKTVSAKTVSQLIEYE